MALLIVALRGNRLLRCQRFAASGAFQAVGLALYRTGSGVADEGLGCGVGADHNANRVADIAVGIQLAVIGVGGFVGFVATICARAGVVVGIFSLRPNGRGLVTEGGALHVRGMAALRAAAGRVGVPADLGAGRLFGRVILIAMPQRGFLHVGSVGATRAGHVSIPTDALTGRGLRGVGYFTMPKRGLLYIGGIVAARAGHVRIPTDTIAGRGLGGVGYFTMPKRGLLYIGGIVAARAGHVGIPTLLGAGRCLRRVALLVMAESTDRLLRGQRFAADAAFFAVGLAACGAGGGVARHGLGGRVRAMRGAGRAAGVTVGIQLAVIGVRGCARLVLTAHTGAGVIMVVDVIGPSRRVIVPDGGLLHVGGKITVSTGLIGIPALFGAGRCLCGVAHRCVTRSGLLRIGGIVTALTVTGDVLLPALLGTGRVLTGMRNGIVAEGGDRHLHGQHISAGGTFRAVREAIFLTGGGITHHNDRGRMRAMRFAGRAALVTVGIQLAVVGVRGEVCLLLAGIAANATMVVIFPVKGPLFGKIMPKRGALLVRGIGTPLTAAGHVIIPTDLRTGGSFRSVKFRIVIQLVDGDGHLLHANGTGARLLTGRFAARRRFHYPFAECVVTGGLLPQHKIQADHHRQRERRAQRDDEPFVVPFLSHCLFLREGC